MNGRQVIRKDENEMSRTTVLLLLLFAGLSLMTALTLTFGPLTLDSFLSTAPPI
jgi:preprotein translocase subunit SecG